MSTLPQGRLLSRNFAFLMAGHSLQALGFTSMLLLPLYLDHLGASRAEIGSILACAGISGLLARPLIGWSLDRIGRKTTLYGGTVCLVFGVALCGAVRELGLLVYAAQLLVGVGTGTLFTGYFALAADIIPPSRRTEGLAVFGISGLLPLALNPVVKELGFAPAELRGLFPVVALLIASSAVCLLPVREPKSAAGPAVSMAGTLRALAQRPLWPVWLATVAFSSLVAVFMAFATVTAETRGLERPAAIWFSYAAGAVCVRLLGARLPARFGPSNVVAPALGCYAGAALLAATGWTDADFLLAGLLAGVGHGYAFPVLSGQVVTRSPQALRGTALASFTAIWALTKLAVTPVFGAVADLWGDPAMFALIALLTSLGLGLWLVLEHRFGHNARRGAEEEHDVLVEEIVQPLSGGNALVEEAVRRSASRPPGGGSSGRTTDRPRA